MNSRRHGRYREQDINTAGLGDPSVPGGYNQPDIGLGTAAQACPGPESGLLADTAAATPDGIDPLNSGYSLGGSHDPLAENDPSNFNIGGGVPSRPFNAPSHPPMASMPVEEDFPAGGNFGADENSGADEEYPVDDDGIDVSVGAVGSERAFEDIDALPSFDELDNDPELAALPVDADGIIEPVVVPDSLIAEPELGPMPDVFLPLEEPIVEVGEEDLDIEIPENALEDPQVEPVAAPESFYLPENQSVLVGKGDKIFYIGRVREGFAPAFAESAFSRALKSLSENTGGNSVSVAGKNHEKVAVVGRSLLVEVTKAWRLPGTDVIFEPRDLLQIVSAKPIQEADEDEDDEIEEDEKPKTPSAEKLRRERLKRDAEIARRRWVEAEKKRKESGDDVDEDEDDGKDEDEDEDKKERKAKKESARREREFLERQKTGGWL